jgi:hypothetical protein
LPKSEIPPDPPLKKGGSLSIPLILKGEEFFNPLCLKGSNFFSPPFLKGIEGDFLRGAYSNASYEMPSIIGSGGPVCRSETVNLVTF